MASISNTPPFPKIEVMGAYLRVGAYLMGATYLIIFPTEVGAYSRGCFLRIYGIPSNFIIDLNCLLSLCFCVLAISSLVCVLIISSYFKSCLACSISYHYLFDVLLINADA